MGEGFGDGFGLGDGFGFGALLSATAAVASLVGVSWFFALSS